MASQKLIESLCRTTQRRVELSRASMAVSAALLEQAKARVQRARQRRMQEVVSASPQKTVISAESAAAKTNVVSGKEKSSLQDHYELICDRVIEGELVQLDGKHFIDCTLRDCILEYGGSPTIFETTEFSGCRFRFTGHAAMTVQLLECFGITDDNATEYTKSVQSDNSSQRPN